MSILTESISAINASCASDTEKSLSLYTNMIADLLDASSVGWLMAFKGRYGRNAWHVDLLNDWKVMDIRFPMQPGLDVSTTKDLYLAMAKQQKGVDPLTQAAITSVGAHRYLMLSEELKSDDDQWIKEQYLHPQGVGDRMLGVFNVGCHIESYLIVDRAIDASIFTKKEAEQLHSYTCMLPRLHYHLALERGLLDFCDKALSPRQIELVKFMLKGYDKRQMAEILGLTEKTIHSYLMDVYKAYKVNSRSELLSLWLKPV